MTIDDFMLLASAPSFRRKPESVGKPFDPIRDCIILYSG
ncbi:hypothetical protein NC99_19530 [Sunxiuqinia dokdonensis]|uniref:Uncharacterized protein n=1 Tax=Sunxiuqinia dokdonensis TaxID=1409788 RepID=A0A0L8V9X9_9BACT|nr:hypothetical protein NC99_19530 [Sunxiuqinia dokdonensis]